MNKSPSLPVAVLSILPAFYIGSNIVTKTEMLPSAKSNAVKIGVPNERIAKFKGSYWNLFKTYDDLDSVQKISNSAQAVFDSVANIKLRRKDSTKIALEHPSLSPSQITSSLNETKRVTDSLVKAKQSHIHSLPIMVPIRF